jgi:hypothetical protein
MQEVQKSKPENTTWMSDELNKIGKADVSRIASLRRDGTLRNAVPIWAVRIGEDIYVRSVNGRSAAWFRGAQVRHEGRIQAGGVDKDVTFVETDADAALHEQIDAAYRAKYGWPSGAVSHITSPAARAATVRLVPR